ncbi:hypothetical protein SAMN05216350_108130 [Polaromonas sp. YR568]|uniref:hypothetical protein n=1 Tax=Polaromonas sp. YR568 TaxID=1855301 RepID=UPI0008E3DA5A|nr:hypothetical protein [Polaromonas sp. YR568]SFU92247.1 hypothetical protein SAMN05216350_108130 [Polaromonas sp. YR568]
MGQWVAKSAAADPGAAWTNTSAEQQFFNSVLLGVTVAVLLAYALSTVVFGYVPVLLPDGFVTLQGIPARIMATGSLALAMGWGSHLVQRHWSGASAVNCSSFRRWCYIATILCWGAVLPAGELNLATSPRWAGLAPSSEALFWPLPRVWRELLPLGSSRVTGSLFPAGAAAFALALLFVKVIKWPRGFLFCVGVTFCVVGFYFLGEAAFEYGAARGLQGVMPDFPREWKANPGHYNAWNFLSWLTALTSLAYGAVFMSCSFIIQADALDAIAARS